MDSKPFERWLIKRPIESPEIVQSTKRLATGKECVRIDDDDVVEKNYKFRVLLPNGTSLDLEIHEAEREIPLDEFVDDVRREYFQVMRKTESQKPKRRINWKSQNLHFVDAFDKKITKRVNLKNFKPNKWYILRLHDGSGEAETYENMWDLTPDTELLKELPEEYTYETALADLIDNSLQAVWSNGENERRLISLEVVEDRITIFDTGPGMDGSEENSVVKWGKMGASLHRSSRAQAIGVKPPYLMPFFGMFGYGGPIASMHLGRYALVSSKTKESKKVYMLHLERDALLGSSSSEKTWRTDGGLRDPSEDEMKKSANGSFTKIEIFEPKMRSMDILQLQCKLKDIYFPYIQCDEVSNTGKTIMPIEFQVNGINLAEIEGGEVAIANLHSCNGPEFVLQLHFHFSRDSAALNSPGSRAYQEANARLKCVYFPIIEGKESIESVLEKLNADGSVITEKYESFSPVSIRRLGRLLPDARWAWLPFMEPRQRKGGRTQTLKRCCSRVKCFIETDAGFNPTPSKTDLAHHHPFTIALKNFGNKPLEKDKDVLVEIHKDGKKLTLLQLEKQYQEWIFQMHDHYDQEVDNGVDQPILVVSPSNKKSLRISSDVLRVHKVIRRKGTSWESGQKIKIFKGACAGCHNNNVYATLEYILIEGFQGDAGGEAQLICRPLGVPDENGCLLEADDENTRIDIRGSISLPVSVIDSGKCQAIETSEWNYQLEKQHQKTPSSIDILSAKHCEELEVQGALPFDARVDAGHVPPDEVVAVVRPVSFVSASTSKTLDQKYISKQNFEMILEIKFSAENGNVQDVKHIYSARVISSSRKGFNGLYIFPLRCKLPELFRKAGVYIFSFSLREFSCVNCEKRVLVKALPEVERWNLLRDKQKAKFSVRVGKCLPPIAIACYDRYNNRTPFKCVPQVMFIVNSSSGLIARVDKMKLNISSKDSVLMIKDVLIESNELDKIRPTYETTLVICSQDESFSVEIPCKVLPGSLQSVATKPPNLENQLLPGHVVNELVLEMFDAYGNHVDEDVEILLHVDGFSFQDKRVPTCKVDDRGCVDLSGVLKVTKGYGKNVSFSVLSGSKIVFKGEFQTAKRELRAASEIPKFSAAGSQLENLVFEIINSEGDVDESMHDEDKHGESHTLIITSESMDLDNSVRYTFCHGRCIVRAIPLPQNEGIFTFVAAHSRHSELNLRIEVHVEQTPIGHHESILPKFSDEKVLLLQDSSAFRAPRVEHDDVHDQSRDGQLLLLQDSSASMVVESLMTEQKGLEDDVFVYGLSIGEREKKLDMLKFQHRAIEQQMSQLQASVDLDFSNESDSVPEKEEMMERIENKGDSAAAVVCKVFKEIPVQEQHDMVSENILGVVALLGTVQSHEISRILADYLGEDQMLAVVCKSDEAANDLEKYDQSGNVNRARSFHKLATILGKSISGRYVVICLEDIRAFMGEFSSDLQRKLVLQDPTLPNGETPPGYLGYAVNMIYLDVHHLHTRTAAGYGLRETLFYRLFDELQVYETRECMRMAKSYMKQGAVSLDGGIIRGNGVLSLGCCEPDIRFPVVTPRSQVHHYPQNMEILKNIEEKKLKLRETLYEIEKETKLYKKDKKKFMKKRNRYAKFLDEKAPLLRSLIDPS